MNWLAITIQQKPRGDLEHKDDLEQNHGNNKKCPSVGGLTLGEPDLNCNGIPQSKMFSSDSSRDGDATTSNYPPS